MVPPGDDSCALTPDGGVYCWGSNALGQAGNGGSVSSALPVAVATNGALSGKTIIDISAGTKSTCVVAADGGAYCWGELGGPTW